MKQIWLLGILIGGIECMQEEHAMTVPTQENTAIMAAVEQHQLWIETNDLVQNLRINNELANQYRRQGSAHLAHEVMVQIRKHTIRPLRRRFTELDKQICEAYEKIAATESALTDYTHHSRTSQHHDETPIQQIKEYECHCMQQEEYEPQRAQLVSLREQKNTLHQIMPIALTVQAHFIDRYPLERTYSHGPYPKHPDVKEEDKALLSQEEQQRLAEEIARVDAQLLPFETKREAIEDARTCESATRALCFSDHGKVSITDDAYHTHEASIRAYRKHLERAALNPRHLSRTTMCDILFSLNRMYQDGIGGPAYPYDSKNMVVALTQSPFVAQLITPVVSSVCLQAARTHLEEGNFRKAKEKISRVHSDLLDEKELPVKDYVKGSVTGSEKLLEYAQQHPELLTEKELILAKYRQACTLNRAYFFRDEKKLRTLLEEIIEAPSPARPNDRIMFDVRSKLAYMLQDGIGGPVDLPRAHALFTRTEPEINQHPERTKNYTRAWMLQRTILAQAWANPKRWYDCPAECEQSVNVHIRTMMTNLQTLISRSAPSYFSSRDQQNYQDFFKWAAWWRAYHPLHNDNGSIDYVHSRKDFEQHLTNCKPLLNSDKELPLSQERWLCSEFLTCLNELTQMYCTGLGGPIDFDRARALFDKSSVVLIYDNFYFHLPDLDDLSAMDRLLNDCYCEWTLAVDFDKLSPLTHYYLAYMLYHGFGGPHLPRTGSWIFRKFVWPKREQFSQRQQEQVHALEKKIRLDNLWHDINRTKECDLPELTHRT